MTESKRPSFARYRDLMEMRGFRPSKKLGQNFLLDPSLHRAIADAADLSADDVVLEVGVGLGFLTRELATRAARVIGVEVDARLAAIVKDDLRDWPDDSGRRVELIECDVLGRGDRLAPPVEAVLAELKQPCVVVANLPYAVSGRFLAAILASGAGDPFEVDRIAVVVQRELADRVAAAPGSREFGSLSVLAQARGEVEVVREIGREVFRPRPNVDSALLRIRAARRLPAGFAPFVRAMFGGRRKTLRHALERFGVPRGDPSIERWGACRAEQCSIEDWLDLHATVADSVKN